MEHHIRMERLYSQIQILTQVRDDIITKINNLQQQRDDCVYKNTGTLKVASAFKPARVFTTKERRKHLQAMLDRNNVPTHLRGNYKKLTAWLSPSDPVEKWDEAIQFQTCNDESIDVLVDI